MLVWRCFIDLCGTRTYHAAGPHPISYAEIEAYARLHRLPLETRHIRLIRVLDRVWLEYANSKAAGKTTPDAAAKRDQGLNPQIFDALFS